MMTDKQKIRDLERRIKELEDRPPIIAFPVPIIQPVPVIQPFPFYPWPPWNPIYIGDDPGSQPINTCTIGSN